LFWLRVLDLVNHSTTLSFSVLVELLYRIVERFLTKINIPVMITD